MSAAEAEEADAGDAAFTAIEDAVFEAYVNDPAGPFARIKRECEAEYAAELEAAAAAKREAEQHLP